MRRANRHAAAAFAVFAMVFAGNAAAQTPEQVQAQEQVEREKINIGLSTEVVSITPDFSGADLTVFGSLENADPQILRQGRYDIIVVLEGPLRPVVVRRKDRIFGIWINAASETFASVPLSYSVAMTRAPQDITDEKNYKLLSLGIDNIYFRPAAENPDPAKIDEFGSALRGIKQRTGLYTQRVGSLTFIGTNLFRASLALPANIPVGTHRARAFLFRNGAFVAEASDQLMIVKSGVEQSIFMAANTHGFLYGVVAVILAVVTGWIGRIVFKRD